MSHNMRYYLKVPANFIPIQILPAKVGRPMLNFGRPIVKCTPKRRCKQVAQHLSTDLVTEMAVEVEYFGQLGQSLWPSMLCMGC